MCTRSGNSQGEWCGQGECCHKMFCNWKVGPVRYDCMDIGGPCYVGAGQCYLGLICGATKTCQMGIGGHCDMRVTGQCSPDLACVYGLCQLKENDPNAHAASSLLTTSLTGTTTPWCCHDGVEGWTASSPRSPPP